MKELITKLVKKHGLKEVAKAAEYNSTQAVGSLMSGVNQMPIFRQKKLAAALGVSIETLKKAHIADIKAMY